MRQQRHRPTGRALGRAALPRRPGDVQVRPLVVLGEAREEAGGNHRTGLARCADVGHVGEVRLQLVLVGLLDRHAPGGIDRGLRRLQQRLGERIVGGEQAGVDVAQRHHAGAGQRGDVDHRCGLKRSA